MLKNIILAAALAGGAAVAAVPAVANTDADHSVNIDADHHGDGIMIDRVVNADGSISITRRFTQADGAIVDVTRIYRMDYCNVTPGKFSPLYNSQANSVSGGVGGAIGGTCILGTTTADNKPLPPQWSRLPYSYTWPAPTVTVHEPAPAG